MKEESIHQGSAIVFRIAGSRMHGHACRFVDDREIVILVHDRQGNVFRFRPQRRRLRLAIDLHALPTFELEAGLGGLALYAHLPLLDQQLHPRPADLRQRLCQVRIQAPALCRRIGRKATNAVLGLKVFEQRDGSLACNSLRHRRAVGRSRRYDAERNRLRRGCRRCRGFPHGVPVCPVVVLHRLAAFPFPDHVLRWH